LDAAFARSGVGTGSGRSEEAVEATRRASGDLTGQISSILGANYQQGLAEQIQTLGSILPGMDQFQSDLLFRALGANALPRQIEQQDLNARYQDFLRRLQESTGNTQLAMQILASQPGFQFAQQQFAPLSFWEQLLLGGVQGGAQGAAGALLR